MAETVRSGRGIVVLTGERVEGTRDGTVILEANGWVTVLGPNGTQSGADSFPPQEVREVIWE